MYNKKNVNDFKKKTMSRVNFDQLLEAGVHFGHLKRKWNPAMAPYIFMERNGIHIIDLYKTVAKVDEAAEVLKNLAKQGKKVLFVATKKQAKQVVADKAAAEKAAAKIINEVVAELDDTTYVEGTNGTVAGEKYCDFSYTGTVSMVSVAQESGATNYYVVFTITQTAAQQTVKA